VAEFVAPTLTVNGRELTADEYRQVPSALTTAFPDAQCTIDQLLCDGDTTTMRITARGTHQGALLGIPPTGAARSASSHSAPTASAQAKSSRSGLLVTCSG